MRYPVLKSEEMSAEQHHILEKISLNNPDAINGPYGSMIYAPEIAKLVYELDVYMTEGLQIPERLRVIAILTAAAKHNPENCHEYLKLKKLPTKDISTETISAIANQSLPISKHEDENLVHEFVNELINRGRVCDSCFERAAMAFGKPACLELVKIAGFTILFNGMANISGRMNTSKET